MWNMFVFKKKKLSKQVHSGRCMQVCSQFFNLCGVFYYFSQFSHSHSFISILMWCFQKYLMCTSRSRSFKNICYSKTKININFFLSINDSLSRTYACKFVCVYLCEYETERERTNNDEYLKIIIMLCTRWKNSQLKQVFFWKHNWSYLIRWDNINNKNWFNM